MGPVWYRVRTVACVLGAFLPCALPAQTIVSGFVKDSLTGRPLIGATVQLVPAATPWLAGRMTQSDSLGRFRLDTVAPGQYLFGFQHPRLDSLGLDAVNSTIFVDKAIRVLRADLAIPSGRSFVTTLCGARADSSTGAVIGRVFNAASGEPIASGTVVVRYAQMRIDGGGVRRVPVQVPAQFGADGRYVACGIPTDVPVMIQARAGAGDAATRAGTSGEVELTFVPRVPLLHRDLLVSLRADDAVATTGGTTPRPAGVLARTGTSRLSGRVVAADGAPVNGARVSVQDTDISATADSNGTFRLTGLPSGTRAVEVVAIGFTPARASVDLRPGQEAALTVNIGAKVSTLASVKVTAPADRSGFRARRATGNGYFFDAAAIEARGLQTVASLLTTAPSLRANGFSTVDPTRPRVSGRGNCTPSLFLDGIQMRDGIDGLDDQVQVRRVGGIEVYANPAQAPPQYRGSGNCATILVWTHAYVP